MSKEKKSNYFIIFLAAIVGIIVYFLFMSEKAIAPVPEREFKSLTIQPSPNASSFQQLTDDKVNANILMYHHIGPLPSNADDIRKGLTVSAEEFESQVKYLKDNGYITLTLGQFDQSIIDKKVPVKIAVLTFDDGYDDNFTQALPILKKYNQVGTFFVITSKIGSTEYMNNDQLKELLNAGNEIGSHSVTHPNLDKLKGSALTKEITQSKEDLEKITGNKIVSFCYPAGKYNDETIKAVSGAGYKIAVTTHASTGIVNLTQLFELSRYRISSNMSLPALLR